jgi:hypothetical protein
MFPSKIPFSDLPSFNRDSTLFDAIIRLVCVITDEKRAELEKEVDLVLSNPDYCQALAAKTALASTMIQKQMMLMSEMAANNLPVTADLMAA